MTKRFVSVWFPYLATDWFMLRQPVLKDTAFVLAAPAQGRMIITATNKIAEAQGMYVGMAVADARAIYPAVQVLDDVPGLKAQLLQRIAEWCIRFAPVAAPHLPEGIILEASGCAHLWGGEKSYLADIHKRLTARGYFNRIAMADTVGAAWAVARFGKEEMIVPTGNQLQALLLLPPAALRLETEVIERLHKLGLRQIKDFVSMPSSALRRRFGIHMLQRINQALGVEDEPVIPVYSVVPYQERLPCIEPIVTRTGIEIALQQLLDAMCNRLRKEGKGLRAAYFRGYRVDNIAQGIQIETSRASHKEAHLFHLFSLKLATIEPALGIELFVLEATKVESYTPEQETLWNAGSSLREVNLSEFIDRLAGRVGMDAIKRYLPAAHYWPERSFAPVASSNEIESANWQTGKRRPLHVLPVPQLIEVTAPIPDYPPMLFRYKNKLHKIVKADGPERIEQEWWIGEGNDRDFYCVEDEEGYHYWLFRSSHYSAEKTYQWFLHGFFA